jgi:hypothetical protein
LAPEALTKTRLVPNFDAAQTSLGPFSSPDARRTP